MKLLLLTMSFFLLKNSNAQDKELIKIISKTIFLHVNTVSYEHLHDSCYYMSTLFKIEIGKKWKVNSIRFSDSAPQWLVEELNKGKSRINFSGIERYAKDKKLRNINLVFPYIIESIPLKCVNKEYILKINQEKYFSFGGEKLSGSVKFCDTLEESFYPH